LRELKSAKAAVVAALVAAMCLLAAHVGVAQEKPRYGGELIFLVPSEPPSYDAHREGTFGTVQPLAPFYNTLLRIDPFDKTGTKPAPDAAESWTISKDGLVYTLKLRQGDYDVAMDFQCSFIVEPDIDLAKFQSHGVTDNNFTRHKDPVLDDLFIKQARAIDPEERKRHLRAFEKRLLDEEVHSIYTLQQHRIIPHSAKVKGWTVTPSHVLNNQLDTVWLAE
jgi:ABC-type transport system substrate-binding protein